jgi:hypothetical protein
MPYARASAFDKKGRAREGSWRATDQQEHGDRAIERKDGGVEQIPEADPEEVGEQQAEERLHGRPQGKAAQWDRREGIRAALRKSALNYWCTRAPSQEREPRVERGRVKQVHVCDSMSTARSAPRQGEEEVRRGRCAKTSPSCPTRPVHGGCGKGASSARAVSARAAVLSCHETRACEQP